MKHYLAVVAIAFGGCTTFDPIARNVCGNGIVEAGEDCDSHDATCIACAVTCTTATECPSAAYACGVDGLCHAPSGVLAPETAPSLFLVDDIRITDIDHDGIGDLLGLSKTSLAVRFGDAHATLTSTYSTVTPPQTGPAGFSDLDGDGTLDTSLATPDGIVTYASPFGQPSPMTSFLPLEVNGQGLPIVALFPLDGVAVGSITKDPNGTTLYVQVLSFDITGLTAQTGGLCNIQVSDFSTDGLDTYQASKKSDATVDVVVAVMAKGATGRHMCAMSIHLDAPAPITGTRTAHFYDITPAITPVPQRKLVWADLDMDNDPCPSLVNSDGGGPGLKMWDGSLGAVGGSHCGIAAVATALPNIAGIGASAAAVGHIPFVPNFLNAFGTDVLVMTTGIYVLGFDAQLHLSFGEVYKSERKLAHVASGDLDGDGKIDAVLTAEGDDDFDIVYRAGDQLIPGYVILRVDTAGVVTSVTIDDYDGNGAADIAYTEDLLDHQALSVAYLDPAHTVSIAPQGTFDKVVSVIPLAIADSSDPYSVIGDVLVLESLASTNTPALTLLHGSPQRTMLSYYDPRPVDDPLRNDVFRQVVGGNFSSSSGTQHRDVLSFLPSLASVSTPSVTGYELSGTDAGLDPNNPLNTGHGAKITGIDDCQVNAATPTGLPCIRNAMLVPWPTAADHDIVIGVDRQPTPQAYLIDPWAFTPGGTTAATTSSTVTSAVPAGAFVHSSASIDLDGNGLPELVLAFAPAETAPASGPGLVEICVMSATGVPQTCADVAAAVQLVAPAVTACVDAAPGHFAGAGPTSGAPTAPELLVLCHDKTGDSLVARVAQVAGAFQATVVASSLGPLRSIAVGDVTGDGVDDVVAIRGDAGARAFTVLAQCESRDLTCQARGVAP